MEKVVKCGQCKQYFGHTEQKNKCPFCKTEYGETAEEKIKEEKLKEKKLVVRTQKKPFKIWKDDQN